MAPSDDELWDEGLAMAELLDLPDLPDEVEWLDIPPLPPWSVADIEEPINNTARPFWMQPE